MYLGIDLGTSSVKTIVIDAEQQLLGSASAALTVSRPAETWAEQNPAEWIAACVSCLSTLHRDLPDALAAVKGIGLSGHMHGATLLDANDEVLRPCILWNDSRSSSQAQALDTQRNRELTGNITFPGFTSPKLGWVRENEPTVFEKVRKVLLPKDYIRLWLTGEHVAEMSDASGTGWLDVSGRCWSDELLAQTHLDVGNMPRLIEGTEVSGIVRERIRTQFGLPNNVKVAGGAGDNAASACGVGVVNPGKAFLSLGTSGVLFAANDAFRPNPESAIHTFCHALPHSWHQMGVILAATDSLNWWSKVTGLTPTELTADLQDCDANSTPLFLPYLGGERTPHNDAAIRGSFIGCSHNSDRASMTRAVLQGVAFAFKDSLDALSRAGTNLQSASVLGGGASSALWLQILADTLDMPLELIRDANLGASFGAARLGLIAAEDAHPADVCSAPERLSTIQPRPAERSRLQDAHERYKNAYKAIKSID